MSSTFLYSIRSRLITALMIPLLPMVVGMIVLSLHNDAEQTAQANESTENYALIASGYQKVILSEMKQLLNTLAETYPDRLSPEACSRTLGRLSARLNEYSNIAVTNRDGIIVCGTGQSTGISLADREYFQTAKRSLQFTLSEALIGRISHKLTLIGVMPWADANGDFAGMVVAGIETQRFADSFRSMPLPAGSRFYLLDRKGGLIAGANNFPAALSDRLKSLPVLGSSPVPFIMHDEDITRSYTGITIENGGLTILIGIPRRFFFNLDPGSLLVSLFGPVLLLMVVVGLISYLSNRLVTTPVHSLMKTARAFSRGDMKARAPIGTSGGELHELALTFGQMADRITKREGELQDAIVKRELMLREIHHRVKNNLQIVISLVNLQSKSVSLAAAQDVFTEIQTRMRALALVHRYLYESDDLQSVNIGAFLTELCSSLQMAYGVSPARVNLDVKTDAVYEVIDRAVPLALFMTETISNALRHAFPEDRLGYIRVQLLSLNTTEASFSVEDNGIGMDADNISSDETVFRTPKPIGGLGMSLAKAFARQVDGDLVVESEGGTLIRLIFRKQPTPPDVAKLP